MIKHISYTGFFLSYLMLIIIIVLTHKEQLKLAKDIFITFGKMSVQLFLAGFLLLYIFKLNSILLTSMILLLMIFFASRIVVYRSKVSFKKITIYLSVSIFISTIIVLSFMLFGIIQLKSFDARYVIPLAGMIIGNSMNSMAINIERFFSKSKDNRELIENFLCLGANRYESLIQIRKDAFASSLLPSLSSASGMGIVFLPGMMTGQILSGTNPIESVSYQVTIVIAIATSVTISNYIILRLLERSVFNDKEQLII
jgi:putative ABC transport system permease protein